MIERSSSELRPTAVFHAVHATVQLRAIQTAVDTAVTIWYGSAADCWKRSFQVGDITTQNGLVEDKLKFQSGREIVEGRWHGGSGSQLQALRENANNRALSQLPGCYRMQQNAARWEVARWAGSRQTAHHEMGGANGRSGRRQARRMLCFAWRFSAEGSATH